MISFIEEFMRCKEKEIALRRLKRILLRSFIASLIIVSVTSTNRAAAGAQAALHASAIMHSPSAPQNPFEGLASIGQGQALMEQRTKQSITAAISKFEEGFALCQKNNNKEGMGAARFAEGVAYDWLGKKHEALSALLDAERYFHDSWIKFMEPMVFAVIGATYASLGEMGKALEYLNRALPALKQANLPQYLAYALKGLGDVNMQLGRKQEALVYLNDAVKLYRQTDDWLNELMVLPLISALYSSLGQSTEAMKFAHETVSRAKEKAALDWEPYGYVAIGAAYASVGKLEEAVTAYNQSLQLLQRQNDATGKALVLNNLGLIYIVRGEFDLALDHFERALKLSKSSDEPRLAAYASSNIAIIYARRGDPIKAFSHYKEALDYAVTHKDKRLEAAIFSPMADGYFMTNSPNHALKLLKEAATTLSAIEEPGYEAEAKLNLADGYTMLGRYQEALDVLRPVLESRRMAQDPGREGYVLMTMGNIYANMGDRGKAITYYAEALAKLEAARNDLGKIDLYAVWGATCVSNGDYSKAEELFAKGLSLARASGLRQKEFLILAVLGFAHEKQGNLAQAESFYDQAIVGAESSRSSARIEELKTEAGSISTIVLWPAILFKFKLGKLSEAFELTESARARTFLDQLNDVRIDARNGADPKLAQQEQSLRFEIRSLEEKLRKELRNNSSSEAVRLITASLKEKEEAYAALLIRLKASNPEYAQRQGYAPVPLTEIQRLLGPQTTLISYFVTSDKTLVFVVRSDSFQAVEIPVKEADLRAAVNWFRSFPSLRDPQPQSLKQLYAWLIAPIQQRIKTAEVVIVPHGILHYVPFAALTDGHSYFGDDHSIYYLPSASTMSSLRRRINYSGKRILAIAQSHAAGLASLRYADGEAGMVAKLYHTQPLLTGRATKAEFMKRASASNMLHIAAHAELNAISPLFSRIVLSADKDNGGETEVREIYGMDLARTNLVTLSACETQLGAQSKGDDVVGLNRAFIYAGASSVIASLWIVDDEATSLLMKTFYGYLKQGRSKAAALQAAQIVTRKKYLHPYYWAAFVLTGDPGKNTEGRTSRRAR